MLPNPVQLCNAASSKSCKLRDLYSVTRGSGGSGPADRLCNNGIVARRHNLCIVCNIFHLLLTVAPFVFVYCLYQLLCLLVANLGVLLWRAQCGSTFRVCLLQALEFYCGVHSQQELFIPDICHFFSTVTIFG